MLLCRGVDCDSHFCPTHTHTHTLSQSKFGIGFTPSLTHKHTRAYCPPPNRQPHRLPPPLPPLLLPSPLLLPPAATVAARSPIRNSSPHLFDRPPGFIRSAHRSRPKSQCGYARSTSANSERRQPLFKGLSVVACKHAPQACILSSTLLLLLSSVPRYSDLHPAAKGIRYTKVCLPCLSVVPCLAYIIPLSLSPL